MDFSEKLSILAEGAQDDISNESRLAAWETDEPGKSVYTGSTMKTHQAGSGAYAGNTTITHQTGNSAYTASTANTPRIPGICSMDTTTGCSQKAMKLGMTNICLNNCAYCGCRASRDIKRGIMSPDEIARFASDLYRKNEIQGLFLSSGIYRSPDYTMELICETIKRLRTMYGFNGYIHAKIMPGSDPKLIEKTAAYADRMSVNIELPSEESLRLIAPDKKKEYLLGPMGYVANMIAQYNDGHKYTGRAASILPSGHTTQMIIGASPESDLKIIKLSESLYKKYKLRRVYYSAFRPVPNSPVLPDIKESPVLRQHRLYQADWLIRTYGFASGELLNDEQPNLSKLVDPKVQWALRNPQLFPVEINKADYGQLIRVPGIGLTGARNILQARKFGSLGFEELKKIGIQLKRSMFFITCRGKFYEKFNMDKAFIEGSLIAQKADAGPEDYSSLPIYPLLEVLEDYVH